MAVDRPDHGDGIDESTLARFTGLAREGAVADAEDLRQRISAAEERGDQREVRRLRLLSQERRDQWVWLVLALVVALIVLLVLWANRGGDGAAGAPSSAPPAAEADSPGDAEPAEGAAAAEAEPAADADAAQPGPPFMEGRHFAIASLFEGQEKRVYTIELVGEGDQGTIRVWEDETGEGTYVIDGQSIRIEMTRMVPPENHLIREPNVFEGVLTPDGSRFDGTWTVEGWFADPDSAELSGEWSTVTFRADRL
ncbi:MAG: hypothetical protein GX427_10465 [Actinomycetales bacterium]|nr:hypothetical protein [Actinomycetales bacterium]